MRKSKVNTTADQNRAEHYNKPMRKCKRPQARENADDLMTIGFSFASDWLWR